MVSQQDLDMAAQSEKVPLPLRQSITFHSYIIFILRPVITKNIQWLRYRFCGKYKIWKEHRHGVASSQSRLGARGRGGYCLQCLVRLVYHGVSNIFKFLHDRLTSIRRVSRNRDTVRNLFRNTIALQQLCSK